MSSPRGDHQSDGPEAFRKLHEPGLTSSDHLIEISRMIVQLIAELLKVPIVVVEELTTDKRRVLAMHREGEITTEGQFALHGTPCERLRQEKEWFYLTCAHERFPEDSFLQENRISTYAGVPVCDSNGEVVAVINVMSDCELEFKPKDIDLLHILAQWMSAEIQMARLIESERRRARHSSTLLEIVRAINSEIEFKDVLKRIARATIDAIGADRCNIFLLDEQRQSLVPTITIFDDGNRALWEEFKREAVIPLGQIVALQRQMESQDVITINNALESPLLPMHLVKRYEVKSVGVARLRSAEGEFLGVMVLDYYRSPHHFTSEEVELLATIAHESSIAITQARLYERAARASFEWRTTFDAMSDGVFLFDMKGRLRRANRAGADLLGEDVRSLIGRHCEDIFSELRLYGCSLEVILQSCKRFEFQMVRAERFLSATFEPTRSRQGQATGIVVVVRDMTERRRLEEREREIQQETHFLLEVAQACSSVLEIDSLLNLLVEKAAKFFGADGCSISLMGDEGQHVARVVSYGVTEEVQSHLKRMAGSELHLTPLAETLIAGEKAVVVNNAAESRLLPPEFQERFPLKSYLAVPLWDRGKLRAVLVIVFAREFHTFSSEEVELIQAFANQTAIAINNASLYEHLKASEERYADLYEHAPAMYHTTDLEGVVLDCNQTEAETIGYAKEEIINRSFYEFLPADSAQIVMESWPKLLSEGRVEGMEFQMRRKDGSLLHVVSDASLVRDAQGRPVAIRSILRDITEKKGLQEQLLRAQRMEAVGTLASGIAHDFNNLLTGVLGYASLAKTLIRPEDEIFEHLDMIEKSALRASELTRQLLAFVRGGKRQAKAVNMKEIIEETLLLLKRGIDKKIVIEQQLADDLPLIEADPAQIQQALLNLCINGCDAMPQGGVLRIEASCEFIEDPYAHKLPDAKPGHFIVVSVTDTGVGMDQATQARIFDPFFTTKEPGRGTGLGLAMVYGIVRNHDGFINVYSELGHGSTFRIYLPVRPAGEEPAVKARATEIRGGDETILIIDDEEYVRRLASHLMRTLGYRVFVAEDGRQGVDIFREHGQEIDLVVLDLTMPRMGGMETFRSLKAMKPNIKVILSSGYTQDSRTEKIMSAGARAFVQKPYQAQELARVVRQVLDSEE